jgi:DNA polymerase-4
VLFESVRGADPSPVLPVGQKRPVVMVEHEFGANGGAGPGLPAAPLCEGDTTDARVLQAALYGLVEQAGAELRRRRLAARRLELVLSYSDGVRAARWLSAAPATANDFRLFALAQKALQLAWTRRVRVRHLRLACERLTFPPAQLMLFPEDDEQARREEGLVAALDAIRAKFGPNAIRWGRVLQPA